MRTFVIASLIMGATSQCVGTPECDPPGASEGQYLLSKQAQKQVSTVSVSAERLHDIAEGMLSRNPEVALLVSMLHSTTDSGPDNDVHGRIIKLIDDHLLKHVKTTFNTTQKSIDDAVSALGTASTSVNTSFTNANSDYTGWKTCIGEEKQAVTDLEAALSAENTALGEKNTSCSGSTGPANQSFQLSPLSCNFAAGGCDSQSVQNWLNSQATNSVFKQQVQYAKEEYERLHVICIAKTAIYQRARASRISKETAFLSKRASCLIKRGDSNTDLCMYAGALKQKCEKHSSYTSASSTATSTNTYLQTDWTDLQLIRCMLDKVVNDAIGQHVKLDSAAMTTCQAWIQTNNLYAIDVGVLNLKQTDVNSYLKNSKDLTALGATQHDCSQTTLTVSLGTWAYPKGLFTPTHSTTYKNQYTENPSGSLTLTLTSGTFPFCNLACTVPNITEGVQNWTAGCVGGQTVQPGTTCGITAKTGYTCTSPGACGHGEWAASGQCRKTLKPSGSTCTSGAECTSGVCAGGECTTPVPTTAPTAAPTASPTAAPTATPTVAPTAAPTATPPTPSAMPGRALHSEGYTAQMLTAHGKVVCMGANYKFERGNEKGNFENLVVHVMDNLENVVDVKSVHQAVAALKQDGTVWTWGSNRMGYLGLGKTDQNYATKVPQKVTSLSGITSISAGQYFFAAIDQNKDVWWWGDLLGFNHNWKHTPEKISGLSNVKQFDAGYISAVALKEDGTVWTAGHSNGNGEIGRSMTGGINWDAPFGQVAVDADGANLPEVKSVAYGGKNCLLVTSTGDVYEFGFKSIQPFKDDGDTKRPLPTKIIGLADISWASVDGNHMESNAIFKSSAGKCFILGKHYRKGASDQWGLCREVLTTPTELTQFQGFLDAKTTTRGQWYLMPNGDMYAAGYNAFGQMGDGTITTENEGHDCDLKKRISGPTPSPTPSPATFARHIYSTEAGHCGMNNGGWDWDGTNGPQSNNVYHNGTYGIQPDGKVYSETESHSVEACKEFCDKFPACEAFIWREAQATGGKEDCLQATGGISLGDGRSWHTCYIKGAEAN